ncbi:Kua-ubiquitin conjugating enzyme hybrid localization domain [Musa troglodytarum]|uniref:Kua-ubiquitin conjugating enzyme hybrid localization domain n=1 Tax=Musa troglodytarum TaxID=320322 RepID=A0A9E7HZM0_9LILI|nr:Kua-ubiquitin conjugating enzyme hybrid localization domain [Musa troglodytarum]
MYTLTPSFRFSRVPRHHHRPCRATISTHPPTVAAPPRLDDVTRMSPTNVAIHDPSSLRSTWSHRAWVATGFASVFSSLAKSVAAAADSGSVVEPLLAAYVGYILADLGTGIYHWAIDNYGGPSTPVFGSQIEAFQGHHRWPWTITRRQFANNLHALARSVALAVLPIEALLYAGGGGGPAGGRGAGVAAHACGAPPGAVQHQLLHRERGVERGTGQVEGVRGGGDVHIL